MLASYPHSRVTSSTAATCEGDRRRGGSIGHRDGRIDWTRGCLGPFMRRLTPQVVVQAGRPHCHQKGPAAHQGVNAASKGTHAHSPRPARTPPVSRGCRFESCWRPSPAYTSPAGTPPHPQSHAHRPSPAYTSPAVPRPHASTGPAPHTHRPQADTHIRSHTRTSGNTKTPEPEAVPEFGGGGWGIRTPEGLHPTRFPSVRHRPLGESSVHIVPDNHKQETPLSANPSQWSRSQMGVRAFTSRR